MDFANSKTFRTAIAAFVITTLLATSATAAPHHRRGNRHHNWNRGGWWHWWNGWNNRKQTGPADTPEIDPALAGGAITLLLGGVLILSDSMRKKNSVPQD